MRVYATPASDERTGQLFGPPWCEDERRPRDPSSPPGKNREGINPPLSYGSMIAGFGCRPNPRIRIGVPFPVVVGEVIPIKRVLCSVTTCKLLVNQRQYCLSCCEAIS